ncbi:uncharacterized protein LOC62_01G001501 [Vanrija pseudolonga]|uniref:Uncharacterized protein n=1 Tax=Vanrija pseudolonga TaxID=143232 RepID=A0AAF0Y6Z3_9TREE|nr:hypothetical protein LOC62_01G001501 [Vanrija pseudolonga]
MMPRRSGRLPERPRDQAQRDAIRTDEDLVTLTSDLLKSATRNAQRYNTPIALWRVAFATDTHRHAVESLRRQVECIRRFNGLVHDYARWDAEDARYQLEVARYAAQRAHWRREAYRLRVHGRSVRAVTKP